MPRRKKAVIILLSAVLLLIVAGVSVSPFVAVNTPLSSLGNGVFSVVFDEAAVRGADKVVLREGEKSLTITDPEQVRKIAKDFTVANSSGLCGYYADRWIDIYNGDRLVRQVHWNDYEDLATVYEADRTHWLSPHKTGQVTLSKEDAAEYARLFNLVQ